MLLIELSQIPREKGLDVETELTPGEIHLEGENSFVLESGSINAHLERGDDRSVQVRGRLVARLGLECGRCLEPFPMTVDQELDLFFLPHQDGEEEDEVDVELTERDMVVGYYRGERLDLGESVREQLFLSLPMKWLCSEACAGLCPTCGVNRNRIRCDCPAAGPDGRLSSLQKLFDK
jgi:uncharacterized protein